MKKTYGIFACIDDDVMRLKDERLREEYTSQAEANQDRIYLQPDYDSSLVVRDMATMKNKRYITINF